MDLEYAKEGAKPSWKYREQGLPPPAPRGLDIGLSPWVNTGVNKLTNWGEYRLTVSCERRQPLGQAVFYALFKPLVILREHGSYKFQTGETRDPGIGTISQQRGFYCAGSSGL
jgi:hypothetical protein